MEETAKNVVKKIDYKHELSVVDAVDTSNGGVKAKVKLVLDGEEYFETFGFSPDQMRHRRWEKHVLVWAGKVEMRLETFRKQRSRGLL